MRTLAIELLESLLNIGDGERERRVEEEEMVFWGQLGNCGVGAQTTYLVGFCESMSEKHKLVNAHQNWD